MSLVDFHQNENRLVGLGIFEANDEWTLSPPTTEDEVTYLPIETQEGNGSWLVFNQSRGLWGTILRSDDTPYNDCLPPSEQLLLDSFRENEDLNDLLQDLYTRTEDRFLNPFLAVLGNVTEGKLAWFNGSFQSEHGDLDPGRHFLRDHADVNDNPGSVGLDLSAEVTLDAVKEELNEKGLDETYDEHLDLDGMRSPRSTVLFYLTPGELNLEHTTSYRSEPTWNSHRPSAVSES